MLSPRRDPKKARELIGGEGHEAEPMEGGGEEDIHVNVMISNGNHREGKKKATCRRTSQLKGAREKKKGAEEVVRHD